MGTTETTERDPLANYSAAEQRRGLDKVLDDMTEPEPPLPDGAAVERFIARYRGTLPHGWNVSVDVRRHWSSMQYVRNGVRWGVSLLPPVKGCGLGSGETLSEAFASAERDDGLKPADRQQLENFRKLQAAASEEHDRMAESDA